MILAFLWGCGIKFSKVLKETCKVRPNIQNHSLFAFEHRVLGQSPLGLGLALSFGFLSYNEEEAQSLSVTV